MEKTLEELQKAVSFLEKENGTLKNLLKEYGEKVSESEETLTTYKDFLSIEDFPKVEENLANYKVLVDKFGSFDAIKEGLSTIDTVKDLGGVDSIKESLEKLKGIEDLGTNEEIKLAIDTLLQVSELGTLDEIKASVSALESYSEIGSLEEVKSIKESLDAYKTLGSVEEVKESLDSMAKVTELGTVEELQAAVETLEKVAEFGSLEDLNEASEILSKYVELGTVAMLAEAKESAEALDKLGYTVESVEKLITERAEEEENARINTLVESFNISFDGAKSTIEMKGGDIDAARDYLESLGLSKSTLVGKKVEKVDESVKSDAERSKFKPKRTMLSKM